MTNYITPIKNQLDEKMHEVCSMFMLIGNKRETPRYYNIDSLDDGLLRIGSTQNSSLYFEIKTELNFINFDNFWQQFKEYRTKFLFENYPSIEQCGINLSNLKK
tara:strand:+ start:46 stop:357 length:312 start_codon:yes stop_codon:yes gene_type:complete